MVTGTVLRSHAGGYLVHARDLNTIFQCAARGRLKKERKSILTGDWVELDEINEGKATAVIAARLDRENILSRPQLANVDQVIIVQATHQPEWIPLLGDRYIVHFQLQLPGSLPVLCFNKCDLSDQSELTALRSIYEPLGYIVMIVSAKMGIGMHELAQSLRDKVSVLAGPSGVGKSSLLNTLQPTLSLRTGIMENEFGVGRHTTTSSELYEISEPFNDKSCHAWVADTPGFNLYELEHPAPAEVVWQFPEILELAHDCRFLDCLHIVEDGCNVLAHLADLKESRYGSYRQIVTEAQQEQRERRDMPHKIETTVKSVGGKKDGATKIPKLSSKYRSASRRTERQRVNTMTFEESEDGDFEKTESDQ